MAVKAVIMAAGQGTRMKSDMPKVLHEVAGRPMVHWVIDAARAAGIDRIMVVVGHGADEVSAALPDGVETCLQAEQLGTGHAVQIAVDALGNISGDTVLVLSGDTPLLRAERLEQLMNQLGIDKSAAALLTADMDEPAGYGRIVRDGAGQVVGIVEHKDASPDQLAITEINAGIYAFDGARLLEGLAELSNDNAQGEYYLTDVVAYLARGNQAMAGLLTEIEDVAGVNSQSHLADANRVMYRRIAVAWMEQGVWIQDPSQVFISADSTIEPGVQIFAGVHLQAASHVGAGAHVGPDVFSHASTIGEGAKVWYGVLREATVGPQAEAGPYFSLRPGSVLHEGAQVGTFVELKNTTLGEGARVPHLSYMGDASIGEGANVGAGTITCNYDGVHKHSTEIGARAFIGCDTMLIAPVSIGTDAVTGAGSTISRDVPDRALGVERSAQREIAGYADRVDSRRKAKEERS